jgi:hypothetical protein
VTSTVWPAVDLAEAVVSFLLMATYAFSARRIEDGHGDALSASPEGLKETLSTIDPDSIGVSDFGRVVGN